jgi:hypothetical protein
MSDTNGTLGDAAAPELVFVAHVSVEVGDPIDIGDLPDGHRRLVPILGGSVRGPEINGRVLAGGADNQILRSATSTELEARYVLETVEGERIAVHNVGIRSGSDDDIAAIVRGEVVPHERIYFRSLPRLTSAAPRLNWINETLFVAKGRRLPDSVELTVFRIG